MTQLAIQGGSPVRDRPFPSYVTIGEEEKRAVLEVLDSAVLSKFLGTWSRDFYGGPRVQALEAEWAAYFGAKHAVSVNSATSGLYAAAGAAGISPGDEVIVSPYTMSASATAAIVYGGVPVFADILPDIFCLDPAAVERAVTPCTKAIIAVDLFGHPADMDDIMQIAARHGLTVIEDAAQSPGASSHGRSAGTLGHVGVFSLNYHKAIHAGEGGVVVTDDDELAERVRLIRNHAEVVVGAKGVDNLINMVGFNYRMTEIEAVIAREQLMKLEGFTAPRVALATTLSEQLSEFPGLLPPVVRPSTRHTYYVYALRYDAEITGVPRARFLEALNAEGIPFFSGYVQPLYLEPMYQQRIAFGASGYPFKGSHYQGHVSYERGICPVTERMHYSELIYTNIIHSGTQMDDLSDIVRAFEKVYDNMDGLRTSP